MKLYFRLITIIVVSIITMSALFGQTITSQFNSFVSEKDYTKAGEIGQQALLENPSDYNFTIKVGDVYFELEEFDKALDVYTKARNISNKDNLAIAKVGRTLAKVGRSQEAIADITKVLAKDKKNIALILALANCYLAANDTKNAELQVMNARSLDNTNPEVFTTLGNLYYEQNIWELARTNYEDALKLASDNVSARQNLAEVYWKLAVAASSAGDVDLLNEFLNRSLAECNTLVQNDPKDANSWRLKGQIHFNAEQKLEAAQSYNKFLELRPNNIKERWRLSELLATSGVCEEAINNLQIVVKSNNADMTDSIKHLADLYMGSCYYKLKNYKLAIQSFFKADSHTKLTTDDLKLFALSYLFDTDTTSALGVFNRLFEMAPAECADFLLLVGARIYSPNKMYEDAIRVLSIRNTYCPPDANTAYCYYLIGTSYFELKNIDASITALQKAIEINPNYYYAYIYLGDIYINQKNIIEGEKLFNLVIENGKNDVEKYKNELAMAFQKLAGIRLENKKYSDLQKVAKQWLELLPDKNEFANLYLAVAYQGNADQPNACKYYKEVLKINPDNKSAKDNIRALGC